MLWQYSSEHRSFPFVCTSFCLSLVPTHRLKIGIQCHLCSSRHFQMTQQLTHLLCKHTHIHRYKLQPPPATPREACTALKPCALSVPPVLLPCTSSTRSKPPQRPPHSSPRLCLSAHLPVFRSLSLPPSCPPLTFSHTPPWEDNLYFLLFFF